MTCLVTGATGFLGSHLLEALVAQQVPMRALVRTAAKAAALRERGIDVHIGDIRDPAGTRDAVRDVEIVFHCAAARGGPPPKEEVRSTNSFGLQNVLEALRQSGSGRLVFVSGLSVLGMRNLTAAAEGLPWRRSGDCEADTKIQAEQSILHFHQQHGVDAVILRPGIVYGPGDENLSQVLKAVREGGFTYIGSRDNIVPLIHVDDFVEVALLAARSPQAAGRVYHITDGSETTIGAIVDYLAELSGAKRPGLVLPYVIPYFGCLMFEMLQRLHLRSRPGPIDRAVLRFLGSSRSVSIRRAQEELGFEPKIRFREGIASTLQELEKQR